MDPSWINPLPEPLRTILIGAAGDFAGGLAADMVGRLLGAAGYQVQKRFRPGPQQAALNGAMAEALLLTVRRQTDDPILQGHYLDLFGQWTYRDAVAGELSQVIDPRPDAEIDLDLLAAEFEAAGYDPNLLGDVGFQDVVAQVVANFYDAASRQPALQGKIEIGLLRGIAGRAEEQVQLLRRMADSLERQPETVQPGKPVASTTVTIDGHDNTVVTGTVEGDLTVVHGAQRTGQIDPARLRTAYLNRVLEQCSALPVAGVDRKAASEAERRMSLDAVYTALLTKASETSEQMTRSELAGREPRRLSAVDQLNHHGRLVLLGDPGSGKSTFVNFAALCLAGQALGNPNANLALLTAPLPVDGERRAGSKPQDQQPQHWDQGTILPVRIVLRDFAARGLPPASQRGSASHLWRFIAAELQAAALGDFAPAMKKELQEQGGLLLLDGLDEVPDAEKRRTQIQQIVSDFAASFKSCRILVTSRTYAYQQQDWRLPGFAEAVLAPFSAGQIRLFIQRWYAHIGELRHLDPADAQGRGVLLQGAIFASDRLLALAERPLLLTLMASLHAWRGGSLPEKREELYNDAVDLLLDWWESQRVVRSADGSVLNILPSMAEWLRIDHREQVRSLLNKLAYEAHANQPALVGTADVSEGALVSGLMRLSNNPNVNPAQVVEFLSNRAGLLVPRGVGVYTFPHRTFQEYLAACHLTDASFPEEVGKLVTQDGERWREVALLAGAKAARGAMASAWNLAEELCHHDVPEHPAPTQGLTALLAAQTLIESGALTQVSERNRPKAERVRQWLLAIVRQGLLSPVDRAAAGDALCVMGDDRPGVGVRADGVPDIVWCSVPAGEFTMGSKNNSEAVFGGNETPQHRPTLPAFEISKYCVTNVQFDAFVQDGGYTDQRWRNCWTKDGLLWKKDRTGPEKYGRAFDLANHPVVMVTWYEAMAFCNWLGWKLGRPVSLPSEAQWERAARHTVGRRYPWGEQITPDHANYDETGIGTTAVVGIFPQGASECGALDMSGNAWEWTRSLWGKYWQKSSFNYPYNSLDKAREDVDASFDILRVLRGGSFPLDARSVRCAVRFRRSPNNRHWRSGFRVVVASP